MKSLLIINQSSPYRSASGQESVDLAIAAANFGQQVSLLFCDDGVFQLLNRQQPKAILAKHYTKAFGALEFYDIEPIYVCQRSMALRGLSKDDLCIEVEYLSSESIQTTLANHDISLRF